jgi:type I restriction enzyme S subunit
MSTDRNNWQRLPVVDLCAEHVDCVNRTAPVVSEPTPFKMIRTSNVRDGFIDTEKVRYVTEDTYRRWTRRLVPRRNDVILTREAPLGDVGMVLTDEAIFLGQRLYHFRPDPTKLDAHFLLYALMAPDLQGQIAGFGSGATVEHMRLGDIPRLRISIPPLSEQKRIGRALSAYDELIVNNRRRMRILEETTLALYREWFANFRFPGHDNIKLVESQLGKIPNGWQVKKATDAIFVNPQTWVSKNQLKPHVAMESLATNSMLIGEVTMRAGNSGSKFKNGDTLFARITPCLENGKTAFVNFLPSDSDVAIGSTEFIVLRSKTLCPEYVYLMARSNEFRDNAIKSMSGATGRQRVQEKCFDKFLIAQPDENTLLEFQTLVKPMFQLVHSLAEKNKNLRRTRDMLLPKLISGEIQVR